jgi:hypothetical protein
MEKTTYRGALNSAFFTKYYLGDQIKKNKMGGACGMHGEEERCIQGLGQDAWRKEATWKTQT